MKIKFKLIISIFVVALIIISGSLVATSLSRYITSKNNIKSSVVAKFDVNEVLEDGGTEQMLSVTLNPGESTTQNVLVTNSGDVLVKYTISVVNSTNNLPLTFTGYSGTIAPGETDFVCPIKISWSAESKDPYYSGKVDMIKLVIQVEQVVEGH